MPGARGFKVSAPARAGSSSTLPKTSSSCSRVIPPGRKITGTSPVVSTMVDSTPTVHAPPSIIPAMRPCISASTVSASVGLGLPDKFAEGAATGVPARRISCAATGCDGIRTATVSSPALTSSGTILLLATITVSGPGQNFSIKSCACFVNPVVNFKISSLSAMCKISGLSFGRPLASKILRTASPLRPSAPSP